MAERKAKILVVEDNTDEAKMLRMILEPEGYKVETASDGNEALRKVDVEPPDLIILDVMMPGLDGFATCSRLKSSPKHKAIPVVLVTAVSKKIRESKYPLNGVLKAEAEEYLEKPVKPEELLAVVAKMLT